MGGKSSKPAFESARSVIARRQPVVKSEAVSDIANSVTITQKPSAVYVDSSNTEGYSADALNTMGNWGDYVVSTSYQNPKIHGAKIQMASMVRHAENTIKLKPNEVLPGRLSESQINEIFHDLRHTEKSFKDIANSFLLDVTDIRSFSRTARMPISYNDKETDELTAR